VHLAGYLLASGSLVSVGTILFSFFFLLRAREALPMFFSVSKYEKRENGRKKKKGKEEEHAVEPSH